MPVNIRSCRCALPKSIGASRNQVISAELVQIDLRPTHAALKNKALHARGSILTPFAASEEINFQSTKINSSHVALENNALNASSCQ
jgi:hypothetical protein